MTRADVEAFLKYSGKKARDWGAIHRAYKKLRDEGLGLYVVRSHHLNKKQRAYLVALKDPPRTVDGFVVRPRRGEQSMLEKKITRISECYNDEGKLNLKVFEGPYSEEKVYAETIRRVAQGEAIEITGTLGGT